MMYRTVKFVIDKDSDGKNVKSYLKYERNFSTRLLIQLKNDEKGLLLNGIHCRTVDILKENDILEVNMPCGENYIEPVYYPLDIIFEDDDILVINKPSGLAMHPTHNHQGDTLANAVIYHYNENNSKIPYMAVGRLDKETSGLVVIAKNKFSASVLQGNYKKEYYAIVGGLFYGSSTVDKKICRPDAGKSYRWIGEDGDNAVTHWTALKHDDRRTLLKINLETGRTHQIRVHFASENAPLAGDDMYKSNDTEIGRVALHCGKLVLKHPVTGEILNFEVDLPCDMKIIVDKMK